MKIVGVILCSLFICFAGVFKGFSQGSSCEDVEPFCAGSDELVFENSNPQNEGLPNAQTGPYYGCLETQPYPAWFFLQIEEDGNLNFTISQFQNRDGSGVQLDVDFIVWGPFRRGEEYCNNEALSQENMIDCSYAPDTMEQMFIPNAQEDDIYVVLITNFDREPGYISLQQTNIDDSGAGSTDCTILESTLGPDRVICGENEAVLDGTTEGATGYEWYVFNENTNEYEIIPGETGASLTVAETGNYRIVVFDEQTGDTDDDDVNVSFFEQPVANEPDELFFCEGAEGGVDLRQRDAQILEGNSSGENYEVLYYINQQSLENDEPITNPQEFGIEEDRTILARVVGEESGCTSEVVNLDLTLLEAIEGNLPETTIICVNLEGDLVQEQNLGEDLGSDYAYEWFAREEMISENPVLVLNQVPEEDSYTLNITNTRAGCTISLTTRFQLYSAPEEVLVEIEGSDFTGGYVVTAEAIGGVGEENTQYEYRLDSGSWQESNVFSDVPPGEHQITAREINGCGETASERFQLIGYPRFFTPNADGYNDTWNLTGESGLEIKKIYIFDRYGKLLKQLTPGGAGWDGTFNGRNLPADDYWFKLEYTDPVTGANKEFSANFTLKR